jgi:iron complex transport system permease protein
MTGPIKQRGNPLISLLIIGGLVAILLACSLGETPMRPLDLLRAMTGSGDPANSVIVWSIRLPRALAAWMVGAALGLSGAALQGLLRNPLAEPGVLGVSVWASLGAVIAIYYGLSSQFAPALQIGAVLGALFATGMIALAARGLGDTVSLILIGVGLSSLGGALVSLALNLAPNPFTLNDMVSWMMGSVANRSFADIGLSGPIIAVGAALILATRRGLSALTLGEETAHGLGLDLVRTRLLVTVGCGLAAGGSVALAGAIGFVGIITPHLVRPWVGGDPGRALVPSALAGGVLLVLADIGARLVPSDNELKLGVVAALIGAPVFLWIAARRCPNRVSA